MEVTVAGGEGPRQAGWLAPAFVDLQVNGFAGVDFNSPEITVGDYRRVVEALWTTGVTRFCPTIITAPQEDLCRCLATAARAAEDQVAGPAIAGIHLEGPYISPEDGPRGAHRRDAVRPPNQAEFAALQEAARGRLRLVTLAPEVPGALPFIEWLAGQGIVVAVGHSDASPVQIREAVAAGARLSTHLGNGLADRLHRHHNLVWEQLAADEMAASFIVDGHHLPPAAVKVMIRAKGVSRCVLITDAVAPAGCPPGAYRLGSQAIELTADGRVKLAGLDRLAGSALRLDVAVANTVRFAGVSLAEALDMAGPLPAAILGRDFPQDFVLFDYAAGQLQLMVRATVRQGELVWLDTSATAPN